MKPINKGNGCGFSWMPKFLKDLLFNWFHEASCDDHDKWYATGGSSTTRKYYDVMFLMAMKSDCNKFRGVSRLIRLIQAYLYYSLARSFGWLSFNYR